MPLITGTSYVASIDWQAAELRVYIRAAANCFPSGRPTTQFFFLAMVLCRSEIHLFLFPPRAIAYSSFQTARTRRRRKGRLSFSFPPRRDDNCSLQTSAGSKLRDITSFPLFSSIAVIEIQKEPRTSRTTRTTSLQGCTSGDVLFQSPCAVLLPADAAGREQKGMREPGRSVRGRESIASERAKNTGWPRIYFTE
jgi:hypothetical protein